MNKVWSFYTVLGGYKLGTFADIFQAEKAIHYPDWWHMHWAGEKVAVPVGGTAVMIYLSCKRHTWYVDEETGKLYPSVLGVVYTGKKDVKSVFAAYRRYATKTEEGRVVVGLPRV